jgi:tRNA/tmRNA/rRNA uracil-C5-methylase (TrmA/RlmC/RlmD family)
VKKRDFVTRISSLADQTKKAGFIRFIHFRDGSERTFTSVVNTLSGDRLSWFDDAAPSVGNDVRQVKRMFDSIRRKATRVIECIGDF